MIRHLIMGLTALGNGPSIAYLVAGSMAGMIFGVIPGLGGPVIMSVVLAFIAHIDLEGTLCLFLAMQAGSFFSASITAILLNTPAHAEAFAVTFDGFPMAQKGQAGRALGISACSTCIGGILGCLALIGFIPIMNDLPSLFHPPEYVALIFLALTMVATLGTDAASKAIASVGLGLVVASVGPSAVSGQLRLTFGSVGLTGGVSLVALALGFFAIPQMILVFGTATTIARQDMMGREVVAAAPASLGSSFAPQVVAGIIETLHHPVALFRAAVIGVVTGIVPGIGGFAANFLSYGIAERTTRNRRGQFGTGIAEGIIAPEGSSLSKEAGGVIPLLALGIPGGVGMAIFLEALTLKGVRPGLGFTDLYPTLPYEVMWIIALGGILGTVLGVVSAPLLARVTRVPGLCLVPLVMPLTVIGVFIAEQTYFPVGELLVFSVIGLFLRRLRYAVAAFVIALVLGPTLENNIALTKDLYPGWAAFERPFADLLILLAFVLLAMKAREMRRGRLVAASAQIFPGTGGEATAGSRGTAPHHSSIPEKAAYPFLSMITAIAVVGTGAFVIIYLSKHSSATTAAMPDIGAGLAILGGAWRAIEDTRIWISTRMRARLPSRSATPLLEPTDPDASLHSWVDTSVTGAERIEPTAPTSRGRFPVIAEKSWGRRGQFTREVGALAYFALFIVSCYVFGFNLSIPAFCAFYGLFLTRRAINRVYQRVLFAVVTSSIMWLIAHELIGILHIPFNPIVTL